MAGRIPRSDPAPPGTIFLPLLGGVKNIKNKAVVGQGVGEGVGGSAGLRHF